MLRKPVHILSLGLLLMLAACGQLGQGPLDPWGTAPATGTGPALSLATDAPTYLSRGTVNVRLVNRTAARLNYDLCRASIDRYTDDDWRQAQATLGEVCRGEPRTLGPGQAVTYSFRLDPMMRRGQYRIHARLTDARTNAVVPVISNSFKLESND